MVGKGSACKIVFSHYKCSFDLISETFTLTNRNIVFEKLSSVRTFKTSTIELVAGDANHGKCSYFCLMDPKCEGFHVNGTYCNKIHDAHTALPTTTASDVFVAGKRVVPPMGAI